MEKAASMPIEEVFEDLKTSPEGLTSQEAKLRLKKYGYNKLSEKRQIPFIYKFIKHLTRSIWHFADLLQLSYPTLAAALELGIIILAVVFVNIFVSIFQESRAEKAMETLKSWMPEYAKVIRDGELKKIQLEKLFQETLSFLKKATVSQQMHD